MSTELTRIIPPTISEEDYFHVFRVVMEMSDDGFILVDRNGLVVAINEPYAAFLGSPVNELVGLHVTKVISNTELVEIMEYGRRDINFISVINQLEIKPDSKDKISSITRSVIKNSHNETVGAVAQVKFRNQILNHAKSLNEFYQVMSSYNEQIIEKIASENEIIAESNQIKKLQLQIDLYKKELDIRKENRPSYAVGTSPNFLEAKNKALRAAKNSFSVLITGETGTGKEVMADYIHWFSERSNQLMVKINCAAIPAELFESELFGYEKGSFTGSLQTGKKGKFVLADKGTIFLDEIGDMPLNMQTKLLRVLQDGMVEPIGATKPVPVDVRIISATNKNLEELIEKKQFRQDLYYRLNEIKLKLPRLAERKSDIMMLSHYLLNTLNWKYENSITFGPEIEKYFLSHNWPGNIRELSNVIKNAFAAADDGVINPGHLPEYILTNYTGDLVETDQPNSLEEYLNLCERKFILNALKVNNCNMKRTAENLGIHRSNLYTKMDKLKITKLELS